ncbi:MAG: hypothetical protein JXQ75_22875, partial [Phycisphaerae bacterium]|nr:hypothetical protein [Phycisphaerae bacterium]
MMTRETKEVLRTGRGWMAAAMIVIVAAATTLLAQENPPLAEPVDDGQVYALRYTATYSVDQLAFGTLHGYDTVRLEHTGCLNQPGQPMLPSHTLRIALPAEMTVTGVRVVATKTVEIAGKYSVFPAQRPRRVSDGGNDTSFIEPDARIYGSTEPYPAELAEFTHQTDLAGQGIALVRLHPVRYTPAEKSLTLYTSIEFELEGVRGYSCGDYLPENTSARGRAAYDRTVADMVVNPDAIELRTSGAAPVPGRGVASGSYDYVIVTTSSWVDDFQPLADWKTKKGTPATIVTTDWIYNSGGYSGTNQQKIRAFVQDAHNTWGAMYFLLGGDTDTIPCDVRTFPSVDPESVPNDTYYADYDADWTCEVHLGRASVRNTSAISTFNNKVFTYEKNPPLSDYAKTIAFFGFDLDDYTDGEDTKIDIDNLYVPSGWTFRSEYDSESGGHKTDVIAYMNQGNHLQNLIDHCNESVMGAGYWNHDTTLSTSDIDALYNGDRQIIFYTLGCWPCAFDYTSCIAEHFVRDSNGGGMAFVGNTRYGWYYQGYDDYLSARFDRYFFRSLFSQGHYILGECFSDHKNDSYENEDVYQYIFTELTLLGDPELPIWTENPLSLAVSHAATLNVGNYTTFPVTVTSGGGPVNTATVCLWKDGDVYEIAQTNSSGVASFGFTPGSAGTMYVTATKHNYLPEESSAEVIAGTTYTLTVNITGSGSVDLDPPGGVYAENTTVELTANANPGWTFDHWENDLSGSDNPDTILMNGNKTVTAVFVEDEYTLTIYVTGNGSVGKNPDQATYNYGDNVQLTANAGTGWHFDHWENDLSGSNNPETITMYGNRTVTAVFVEDQYTLTINITGSGSVTKDPNQATYTYGDDVELTANAGTDWHFDHWEGGLTGSNNPDTITMYSNQTVTAVFVEDQDPLYISFPSGLPEYLTPDVATPFDVQITDGEESYVPGTGTLHYRYDGGTYLTSALTHVSGNIYEATLPPATCDDTPEFYISAEGNLGSTVYSPADAPSTVYSAIVGALATILDDNFETDQGWVAENLGADSGDWQRGVPVNDPGWSYDPASDSDGSGQCFLTQNETGNTDIDDGAVRLTSPTIDMSGGGITISYDYYLYLTNDDGTDRLLVEINNDGGTGSWTEIARHDTNGGLSWRSHTIDQGDLDAAGVTLTANMQIRFTANDDDTQSIVEGGIDAFLITGFQCLPSDGACCFADGSCSVETAADCATAGGTYQGNGTSCTPNPCPVLPGACCLPDGNCQDVADEAACDLLGGAFEGHGTDCATTNCPVLPGACCLPDGSCHDVADEAACDILGGAFEGHGT